MPAPPPSTAESIALHAAASPQRLALRDGDAELTYAQLHHLVQQFAVALHAMGLRRGQRVAIAGPGFGIELVALLAADGLGLVTTSFNPDGDDDADWLFAHVDAVIACRPQAVPPGRLALWIDQAFVARLWDPLPPALPPWEALPMQAPQRITRTAGSTGRSKFILLDRARQEWQVHTAGAAAGWAVTADTKMLLLAGFTINAAFTRATAALRQGAMVLCGPPAQLQLLDPDCIVGLVGQLQEFVAQVPAGYRARRPVTVLSLGAPPTPALRAQVRERFGTAISNRYGGNETAAIADLDESSTGELWEGVEARILDDDGRALPVGASGRLAIRSPGVVDGYLERPEETAAAFHDGWFWSSDVAQLVAPRTLRLLGRRDDMVNLAGRKVPAARLEADLLALPALADAAVQGVLLEGGRVTLGIAAVLASGVGEEAARAQIVQGLRLPPGTPVRLVFLPALPRLASSKVDRLALLRLFTD